jgi:hypothetical protein
LNEPSVAFVGAGLAKAKGFIPKKLLQNLPFFYVPVTTKHTA